MYYIVVEVVGLCVMFLFLKELRIKYIKIIILKIVFLRIWIYDVLN